MNDNEFIPVEITTIPNDAPDWAQVIVSNQAALASGINRIGGTIVAAHGAISTIRDAIDPIIDKLSRNPMFKMLGV